MKKILITSRLIKKASFDETHFSLDVRWLDFFEKCNLQPIVVPPRVKVLKEIFKSLEFDGILLTGGGDIAELGGCDYERDDVETYLICKSIRMGLPLIGICRGMQKIQAYFGENNFENITNNISKRQKTLFYLDSFPFLDVFGVKKKFINSYHHYGVRKNSLKNFNTLSISDSGVIKAIHHKNMKILGLMWHPERNFPFSNFDIKIFKKYYE